MYFSRVNGFPEAIFSIKSEALGRVDASANAPVMRTGNLYGIFLCLALPAWGVDAREIILKSVAQDWRDLELRRNYTCLRNTMEKQYERGAVKSTEQSTYEVSILYGRPYSRLIAKDGKPLPPDKDRKEQEKMDREIAKRKSESERDRQKREAEEKKDLEEERALRREIADAFDFTLLREESVSGMPAYVIKADPKPGFEPKTSRGKFLPKVKGTFWISKADYRWVKVNAEVIDTFSFGWALLRLYPGAKLEFEQTRLGDQVWLPLQARIRGEGRLALVKRYDIEIETKWENYRRFSAESKVMEP